MGTRILAECVTDNADDCTAAEIAAMVQGTGVERVNRIIAYAYRHVPTSVSGWMTRSGGTPD